MMQNRRHLKKFIKNVLGCTCADKVFEQIDETHDQSSSSPHSRTYMIGGRLLVYIWEVREPSQLQQGLHAMLAAGKRERQARGLNRFRAVLAVETVQEAAPLVNHCFSQFTGRDDHMHIHVIPMDDLRNYFPE